MFMILMWFKLTARLWGKIVNYNDPAHFDKIEIIP